MAILEEYYNKKVISLDEFMEKSKVNSDSIIFTNGCFDVIHTGHVELLLQAKSLGGTLVVGINTDDSIRQLKKDKDVKRPVHNLKQRCLLLSAFSFVDYIIPFSENDPTKLLEAIQPAFFVKGGEYKIEDSVGVGMGTKLLDDHHIKFISIPWSYIDSSTEILKKIADNEGF